MIIGIIGHAGHGKTALVRELTGVDTDRLKEERAIGRSIDLGFACWPRSGDDSIYFVDMPGHPKQLRNMLAGATGINFVLLVVAADDGVMPQTREHLAIVDLLGFKQGVVVISKCDLADAGRIRAVRDEVAAALAGTGLEGSPAIPVSAASGQGLAELTAAFDDAFAHSVPRNSVGRFRLAVDRAFRLPGLGTVVTGPILSGSVQVDDTVVISPAGLQARISRITVQGQTRSLGVVGQRCALVLNGAAIRADFIRRGAVVLEPALHAPTLRADAGLMFLASARQPLRQELPVKVHHAAAEVPGRVVNLSDKPIEPGGTGYVQLVLERPIAACVGDRFVIRATSFGNAIGGGALIDLRPPERRRRTLARHAVLDVLSDLDAATALARVLTLPPRWIDVDAFFRDRAITREQAARIESDLGLVTLSVPTGRVGMLPETWQQLRSHIVGNLAAAYAAGPDGPGLALDALRRLRRPLLPVCVFAAVLRRLADSGEVVLDRTWVRHPERVMWLSEEEERTLALIVPRLAAEPYRPPRVRDIAKAMGLEEGRVRSILRKAAQCGDIEEIAQDHFFLSPFVLRMATIAAEIAASAPGERFSAAAFRDRIGSGRKVAIQILESFDRHGLTVRDQDLRRINPAYAAMFGASTKSGSASTTT